MKPFCQTRLNQTFALLSILLFPCVSSGQSVMAVLEYHQPGVSQKSVAKLADRVREEFIRRGEISTLSKGHTEEIFYYHRPLLTREVRNPGMQRQLRDGKQAYYELRLADAEGVFRRLIEMSDNTTGRDEGILLESHLLLGLTLAAQKKEAEAKGAFAEALRLNPNLQINSEFFPPRIVKLFRQVPKAMESTVGSDTVGSVTIHSRPEGGKVYLNGVLSGVTPLKLSSFPAGPHAVRVEAGPRYSSVQAFTLKPGGHLNLAVPLSWRSPPTQASLRQAGLSQASLLGFASREVRSEDQLVQLAAQAGRHLAVQKVLLVGLAGRGKGELRLIDTHLQAPYPVKEFDVSHLEEQSAEIAARLTTEMTPEIRSNLLVNASKKVADRYGGDILLLGHHRKPLYRRPLFWVALGLAGAGGGIGAAVLGGAAATGAIVVVF